MSSVVKYRISPFIALSREIEHALDKGGSALEGVIADAVAANPWYTPTTIGMALKALCSDLLTEEALTRWLATYAKGPAQHPKRVGVIMAGNLPLVGFFDLLCTLLSGHDCLYKPSSKDAILTEWIVRTLLTIAPELPLQRLDPDRLPDAIIATGSSNTNRYFRARYGTIPSLLRTSRTSIAVLTGQESEEELAGLHSDLFDYFGLGCRNVSHLFVPQGYDFSRLVQILQPFAPTHTGYLNNYRQAKALYTMLQHTTIDGGFFLLSDAQAAAPPLSVIRYTRYATLQEVQAWIAGHDDELQCVVTTCFDHPRKVSFGQAQHPLPTDYPDGVDVMQFLLNLD